MPLSGVPVPSLRQMLSFGGLPGGWTLPSASGQRETAAWELASGLLLGEGVKVASLQLEISL